MTQVISYERQKDMFDPDKIYNQTPITIIGAGGIGSFATLSIAKLGLNNITIYDEDVVEKHNIPNQFFTIKDIGRRKVVALKQHVRAFTDIKIKTVSKMWTPEYELEGIIVCAVDSLATRKIIFNKVKLNPKTPFFIDGRIGGDVIQIFSFPSYWEDYKVYEESLNEEPQDLPCTARAIIDVGFMVGALISGIIRRWTVEKKFIYSTVYYANLGQLLY